MQRALHHALDAEFCNHAGAARFAHRGGYASSGSFVDGFTAALWVGAAFSVVGALLAAPPIRRSVPLTGMSPAGGDQTLAPASD